MGVVYIESCCEEKINYRSFSHCNSTNDDNARCDTLLAMLRAAEARIAANTARITQLEAEVFGETAAVRQFFLDNQNSTVTVTTTFGTVTGTVLTVGEDAVEILQPNGDIVILPYTSVITVN
jgi:hypothetical protein